MRRARRILPAALLLLAAVLLRPVPEPAPGGAWAALGRSLGGLRVMVVDALFLRAEGQRRAGRIEDAAALYQAALALDPDNEAAAAYLAGTYVDELMPQLADVEERFAWWEEARALLQRALQRHPHSGELETRLAALILDAPRADPPLGARIAEALGDPQRVALRHLARALEAGATLPRLGRSHLERTALLAPLVAARALRAGERAKLDEALAAGRRALLLHPEVMAEVRLDERPEAASLADALRLGLAAVEHVDAARAGRVERAAAEAAIDAYEALAPGVGLGRPLREALEEGR